MIEEKTRVPNPKPGFQLISPDGHRLGIYDSALEAASAAGGFWPGVGQSEDGGPGWDVATVGAE